MAKRWKICLDKSTGELVPFVSGNWANISDIERLENRYQTVDPDTIFIATLKIAQGCAYYTGSPDITMVDVDNSHSYPLFFDDFFEALKNADLYHGQLTGEWSYTKRNRKQGIRLVREIKFDADGEMISE